LCNGFCLCWFVCLCRTFVVRSLVCVFAFTYLFGWRIFVIFIILVVVAFLFWFDDFSFWLHSCCFNFVCLYVIVDLLSLARVCDCDCFWLFLSVCTLLFECRLYFLIWVSVCFGLCIIVFFPFLQTFSFSFYFLFLLFVLFFFLLFLFVACRPSWFLFDLTVFPPHQCALQCFCLHSLRALRPHIFLVFDWSLLVYPVSSTPIRTNVFCFALTLGLTELLTLGLTHPHTLSTLSVDLTCPCMLLVLSSKTTFSHGHDHFYHRPKTTLAATITTLGTATTTLAGATTTLATTTYDRLTDWLIVRVVGTW